MKNIKKTIPLSIISIALVVCCSCSNRYYKSKQQIFFDTIYVGHPLWQRLFPLQRQDTFNDNFFLLERQARLLLVDTTISFTNKSLDSISTFWQANQTSNCIFLCQKDNARKLGLTLFALTQKELRFLLRQIGKVTTRAIQELPFNGELNLKKNERKLFNLKQISFSAYKE
jgi:hypothetical protein